MMYFDMYPGSYLTFEGPDKYSWGKWDWWDGVDGVIGIAPELVDRGDVPMVAREDMKPGFIFYIGQYKLRCLGYNPHWRAFLARRIDA